MSRAGAALAAALALAGGAAAEPADGDAAAARDADYRRAEAAIAAEDFAAAIAPLERALGRLPDSADVLNLLGFAHRKTGDLDAAEGFYARALRLDPRHVGALEYQGELFLMRGDIAAAKANLERLDAVCWLGCAEEEELAAAIAAFEAGARP